MSVQILVRAKIQSAPGHEINDLRTVVIFGMGSHRIDDAEAESRNFRRNVYRYIGYPGTNAGIEVFVGKSLRYGIAQDIVGIGKATMFTPLNSLLP